MKLKPSQIVVFLLAMVLTASGGASTQPAPEGQRKYYYAILVGVDGIEGKYENFETLKDDKRIRLNWGDLRTCVKDVLNLEESLKKHSPPEVEWEIHKFIEISKSVEYDKPLGNYKTPNAFNIVEQTLAKIAAKARAGQVVLVYLSCHGWYDPKRDDLYFIVPGSNYEDPVTTCVSLKILMRTIAYCEGDVIFMLDACDSGAGNEKGYAENDEEYFDKIIKTVDNKATRVIISSSRRGERSWQMAKGNMSVFTHGIVKVLTGKAGENYKERNGDISISRIISYAKYEIPHLAATEGEARQPQHPVTKVWTKGRPSEEIILAKVNPLMPPPKTPATYVQDRLDEWNAAQGMRRLREPNRTDALKVLWNELQNGVKSQFNAPDAMQSAREGFQAAMPVGAAFFTEDYEVWESRRLGTTTPQDRESKRKAWLTAIQEYFKNENLNEDDYRKLLYKAGIGPALRQVLVNGTEAQPQNSHRVSSVKGGVAVVKVVASPASDQFNVEFTEGGGKAAYDDVVTRRRDTPPTPPEGALAGVPREYEVSLTKKINVLHLKITDVDESGKKLEFSSHTLIIDCKANVTIDSPREKEKVKASKDTFEIAGLVWNDEGKRPNVEVYVGQEKVSKPVVYTEESQEKVSKWKTEVNFQDKKEGNYTLEVRAVDPDNPQHLIAKSLRSIRFERTVLPLVSLPFALPPNATLKADKGNPTLEDNKRQFRLTEEMKERMSFVVEQNGFVVWRGQLKGQAIEPVGNFGGFVARRVPEFKNVTRLQLKPTWVRKDVPYFNFSEQNPFGSDYLPVGVYDLKFDLKGLNPFTLTVTVKEETESIDLAGLLNNNKPTVEQAIQRQNVAVKAWQRRGGKMEPLPDGATVRLVPLESPAADTLQALKDDVRWIAPLWEERDKSLQGKTEGGAASLKAVWAGKYQVWAALPGKKERMAKDGQNPKQDAIVDVRASGDAPSVEVVLFPLSATFKGFEVPPGATVRLAQALRDIEEENGKRIQMVLDDEGEKGEVTVSKGKLVFWRGTLENMEIKPASGDGYVRRTYPLALKNAVKVESIKLIPVENQVPYCDINKQYLPLNFSSRTENAVRWENVPVGVYHLEVKLPGLNALRLEGIVIGETAETAREGNAGGEEAQDLVALLGNHIEEVKRAIPVCETVAVKATRKGKPLDDGATMRLMPSPGGQPLAAQTFAALGGEKIDWIAKLLQEFNAPQTGQPVQNGSATFRRVWAGQYDVLLQLKGKSPRPAKLSNKQKATLTIPVQAEMRAEVFFPQVVAVFKSVKPEMGLRGLELVPVSGGAPIAIEGDKVAKTEDVDSDVLYRLQWKKSAASPRWTPVPKEIKISDDKEEESFDVDFKRNTAPVTFKLDARSKPADALPCVLRPKPEPDDVGWTGAAVPVSLSAQQAECRSEVEVGQYEIPEGWELVSEKPSENVGRLNVYGEKVVTLRRQVYSSRLSRNLPVWGTVIVETKQGAKPLVDKEGRLSKELGEDGDFPFTALREDNPDRDKKGKVFIRHRGDEPVASIMVDDKSSEVELDRLVDIVWRLPTPNTIPIEFLNISPDIKEVEVNFTRIKLMPDGEIVRMPIKLTMKRQGQGNDFVAAGNWDAWIEICPRLKDCDKKNPRTEQCPFFVDPNDGKRYILEVNKNYYKASDKVDKGKLIITLKDSRAP